MRSRLINGDVGLALVFASLGLVWILGALRLPLWEGFAPQSGFLPLAYGLLLTALAIAVLVARVLENDGGEPDAPPIGKPLTILAALTVTVVGVEAAGFGVAVFVLLVFLFAGVERLPLLRSLFVSGAVAAALVLVFRIWLAVPLPAGPLGF
jgi:Tripartite tricarboxylate transporter TctB family